MVKSSKLYSPSQYLEMVTGNYYIVDGDDDCKRIQEILTTTDAGPLWDYPISEIEHIVENNIPVALVDCMLWDDEIHEYGHELRWFEVPEDLEIEED